MSNISLFKSAEQREIDSLKRQVRTLTAEVQSLSESLTQLIEQVYHTMEVMGLGKRTSSTEQ